MDRQEQAHIDRTADIVERRVAASAIAIQAQFEGVIRIIDHRVDANKMQSEERLEALNKISLTRNETLRELIFSCLAAMEKARAIQAIEYERRLELLNHENQRIIEAQSTFVRLDTNAKDWDRLHAERDAEQTIGLQARIVQETTADSARRNTFLAIVSGAIAICSLVVTVLLHFAGAPLH